MMKLDSPVSKVWPATSGRVKTSDLQLLALYDIANDTYAQNCSFDYRGEKY